MDPGQRPYTKKHKTQQRTQKFESCEKVMEKIKTSKTLTRRKKEMESLCFHFSITCIALLYLSVSVQLHTPNFLLLLMMFGKFKWGEFFF